MDNRRIIQGLAYLELATGEHLTDERRVVYVEQLNDLRNEQAFADAIAGLAQHSSWYPKIPEIREAYRAAQARQPSHNMLGEHTPSPEERRETGKVLRAWMAETFGTGDVLQTMDRPHRREGQHRTRPTHVYEPREPPGGNP